MHGFDGHRFGDIDLAHPRHAHEARLSIYLGRARSAFAGLAVPAHGHVIGLGGLDAVNNVQHNHAILDLGLVIDEPAGLTLAAPYFENHGSGHYLFSSTTCFNSEGISLMGTCVTFTPP